MMWLIVPTIIVGVFLFLIFVVIVAAICIEIDCLEESSMNVGFVSLIAIFSAMICVAAIYGSVLIGNFVFDNITRPYNIVEVCQIEPYKTMIVFEYGDELRFIYKNNNYNSYENSTYIDVSINDLYNSSIVNK